MKLLKRRYYFVLMSFQIMSYKVERCITFLSIVKNDLLLMSRSIVIKLIVFVYILLWYMVVGLIKEISLQNTWWKWLFIYISFSYWWLWLWTFNLRKLCEINMYDIILCDWRCTNGWTSSIIDDPIFIGQLTCSCGIDSYIKRMLSMEYWQYNHHLGLLWHG